jgi:hypothetical protein
VLNPEHAIVVLARPQGTAEAEAEAGAQSRTGSEAGTLLLGLHPEPGNYASYLPPGAEPPPEGTCYELRCPLCRAELSAKNAERMCALDLEEGGEKRQVLFSAVAGERATFVVDGSDVVARFGEHAEERLSQLAYMKYNLA